jgi:hypothetical protein
VRGGLVLIGAVALASAPATAHAGRSFFGWLIGSEVMPERSVEIQTWISEENRLEPENNLSRSTWGLGPFVGITDQLELSMPLELWWQRVPTMPGSTQLHNYGIEARYRLVTQDPVEAPPFVPLVRVGVRRLVKDRDTMAPEVGLVATYEAGSVVVDANAGVVGAVTRDDTSFRLRSGAGVSVLAVGDLRVGAELFAEVPFDATGDTWLVAGPNLSWTHGRFWVSAAYGIGLSNVKDAPRMQWGIAF